MSTQSWPLHFFQILECIYCRRAIIKGVNHYNDSLDLDIQRQFPKKRYVKWLLCIKAPLWVREIWHILEEHSDAAMGKPCKSNFLESRVSTIHGQPAKNCFLSFILKNKKTKAVDILMMQAFYLTGAICIWTLTSAGLECTQLITSPWSLVQQCLSAAFPW